MFKKVPSYLYNTPGPVRPARPLRCSADDFDTQNSFKRCPLHEASYDISFTFPESTTKRIPSTVKDVSAIFVETIHLRIPSGA